MKDELLKLHELYPHIPMEILSNVMNKGAEWQYNRMFTEDEMFLFAGFMMGKKMVDPFIDARKVMEEWKIEVRYNPIINEITKKNGPNP